MQIEFDNVNQATGARAAAIVGDAVGDILGKPSAVYPALLFNVTAQPSGSDIFAAGSNGNYATALAAAFTRPAWHEVTVSAGDVAILRFAVVVFPAAVLTYEPIA